MLCALLAVGLLQVAPPNGRPRSRLDEARVQVEDFEYDRALKTLELAFAQAGNDRETTLGILELQGIVWGNLNKGPKARTSFVTLLSLDPERKLSGDHPPRVRTPFYEAKEIVATAGPLALTREPLQKEGERIVSVAVAVSHDSLKLTRAARFHLDPGAGQTRTVTQPLDAGGKALVPAGATAVRWWVELLGDKEAVLMLLGSAAQPLVDDATPPKVAEPVAPISIEEAASPPLAATWMRPTAIGLAGGAAVAGGVGVWFAVNSNDARNLIANAARDPSGGVTGITQRQAADADARARSSALAANVLLGTAGGLLGLGVVLFILGSPDDVVVTPAGPGVTVSGRF